LSSHLNFPDAWHEFRLRIALTAADNLNGL
jgi:hypothetical protein